MSKIYLCGPMTGLPGFNHEMFKFAAHKLRELDFTVVCPTEINSPEDKEPWEQCLKKCFVQLLSCDTIAYLPGWHNSRGATFEIIVAKLLGYEFVEISQINPADDLFVVRYHYSPRSNFVVSAFIRKNFPGLST